MGRYSLAAWFRFGLRLAGETNLTKDNVLDILSQTGPFLVLTSYMVLVAGVILLEFLILVYMVATSYRSFAFVDMLKALRRKVAWLSGPQLLIFLAYLVLMIPIGNLGLTSTLLQRFRIPDFILGELTKTGVGTGLYYMGMALILYLNIRLIYFLPLSVINRRTPWTNLRQSWQITRQHKLQLILTILGLDLILISGGFGFMFGITLLFESLDSHWNNLALQTLFYTLVKGGFYLLNFLFKLSMVEVLINHLLHLDQEEGDTYFSLLESDDRPFSYPKWSQGFLLVILLGFIAYNGLQLYLVSLNQEQGSKPLMIAHRGDVKSGVENSIEALEGAKRAKAHLVEIDVVMTADKRLAVIHDNHLKRLAGLDWQVSDKTMAELEGVTVAQGDFHSKISSLETFVERARNLNQPLLIEFKLYGHEPSNYTDLVLAQLNKLKLTEQDRLMSMDLDLMEAIEKERPEMQTGYVIPLQLGTFSEQAIDFYVIEDFSYNDLSMLSAENQQKEVYVWTINDPDVMAAYLQSPVNGIITDELAMLSEEEAALADDSNYLERVWRLLLMEVR